MSWDAKLFQRHLETRRFGREFVWFDAIDSTNRWLADNATQFSMSGAVVAAGYQEQGKGRYNRDWFGGKGSSLLFSLLLRNPVQNNIFGYLSLLPAIALGDLLHEKYSHEIGVRLKWPNDVMLNGRKVAGILGQRIRIQEEDQYVIGVGVNVSVETGDFPDAYRDRATSILMETGEAPPKEVLLCELLQRWETLYDVLLAQQYSVIRGRWERLGPAKGTLLTRNEGGQEYQGRFFGLGPQGQLQLADESGTIREFFSGDVQ